MITREEKAGSYLGCTLLKFRFLSEGRNFRNSCDFGEGSGKRLSENATQTSPLAKVQKGSSLLTMPSSVVVALMGSFKLPRLVVIKLEDAEMPLQVAVSVLLVLRVASDIIGTLTGIGPKSTTFFCIGGPESEFPGIPSSLVGVTVMCNLRSSYTGEAAGECDFCVETPGHPRLLERIDNTTAARERSMEIGLGHMMHLDPASLRGALEVTLEITTVVILSLEWYLQPAPTAAD